MGSSGMTAQAFGAKDHLAQSRILQQALLVAMLAGIANDSPTTSGVRSRTMVHGCRGRHRRTRTHLLWKFSYGGAPAVLGTYVMSGWFLGMQNSRAPMWVSIFINLCNIAVSLVLVYCFNYDIPVWP